MSLVSDYFQELAYDFPVVGPSADILLRDASYSTLIPGSGFIGTTDIEKSQSILSFGVYSSASIAMAGFSDGPFALWTTRKMFLAARMAKFTPVGLAISAAYHSSTYEFGSPEQEAAFNLHRGRSR